MQKILIANRGEVAVRIISTLKSLGITSVAIYSDADADALFVQLADEAYHVGASPSSESYLNMDKILSIAKEQNIDGIHPGYGFLSENGIFAKRVEDEGIIFIGPSSEAMAIMGDKLSAKELAIANSIPLVPGSEGAITDMEEAKTIASKITYPILIKASAGGGGKGMRIVEKESDFEEQFQLASSEAMSSFGNAACFIEKYVTTPRHIEIQVLADKHGNVVHLFERECSIQRRHQKVVEEAPSCVLSEDLRNKMGAAAIKITKACDYVGAGTIEFLIDDQDNFYFLEMNTRLQVEHAVTEMITGLDLVELQISVANGAPLPFEQSDIKINGHSLELRVYAEDPFQNFIPSIGTLEIYQLPNIDGVRIDNGFVEGMDIPIYYDPMISKLIVHANSRMEAIQLMKDAIDQYHIKGIENTLSFGRFVMNHSSFVSGNFNTHFVKEFFTDDTITSYYNKAHQAAFLLAKSLMQDSNKKIQLVNSNDTAWSNR